MNSLSDYILSLHPQKVAIIASMYPPYPDGVQHLWGGTEIDIEDLVSSLHQNSVQTRILSLHYIQPSNKTETDITRIGTYTPYVLSGKRKALLDFIYKEFFRPLIFMRLIRLLKAEKPDLVIIGKTYQFSLAIYVACRVLHLPYIIRYDWTCPSYPKEELCTIRNAFDCPDCLERNMMIKVPKPVKKMAPFYLVPLFILKRYFWNRSLNVMVVSRFYEQIALSFGINPLKIQIAPPKSQLRLDYKEILKLKSLYKKENEFIILFVGRLEFEKGILLLLKAFELLKVTKTKNLKLLIVGTGNLASAVNTASKKDSRIVDIGLVPHSKVGNYFAIADLVVVPSIVSEAYGLVAIEALSLDKPVIGFNIGGLKEILINSQRGFLVDSMSAESMAQGINYYIDNFIKYSESTSG
jgi:glycosyltransferase involved in cell wall biosynthesis